MSIYDAAGAGRSRTPKEKPRVKSLVRKPITTGGTSNVKKKSAFRYGRSGRTGTVLSENTKLG